MEFIKKHKLKIIGIAVCLAVLTIAFFIGGDAPSESASVTLPPITAGTAAPSPTVTPEATPTSEATPTPEAAPTPTATETATATAATNTVTAMAKNTPTADAKSTQEPIIISVAEDEPRLYCTLSVRCDTILKKISDFNKDKLGILPQDGVILPPVKVEFKDGESAFDALLAATRENNIHFEFTRSPVYNTAYIEGIANIYEFDCGDLSGWMYKVNGRIPNYGISDYRLKDGDIIELLYTCNMGMDI